MSNVLGDSGYNYFTQAVFNALVPKEGPKAVAVLAPFTSSAQTFTIDFTLTMNQGYMSLIQGVYVDNSLNADVVNIKCSGTGQSVNFPAGGQGYIPLVVAKPTTMQVTSAGQVNVQFVFLNVPVPAIIWGTSSGGGGGSSTTDGPLYPAAVTATQSSMAGAYMGSWTGANGDQAALTMDTTGNLRVLASGYNNNSGAPANLLVDNSGNLLINSFQTLYVQDEADGPVAPGAAASYSMLVGGVYNSAGITLTNGQQAAIQFDSAGNLKVNIAADADNPIPTSDAADGSVAPGMAASKSMLGGMIYTSAGVTLTNGQQAALQSDSQGNLKVNVAANTDTPLPVAGSLTNTGITSVTRLSAASNTTGVIKASSASIGFLAIQNTAATARYLHLYNQATSPTLGTSTPLVTIPLAAVSSIVLSLFTALRFGTGLSYALTTDDAAIPATAATAGDVQATIGYL